MAGNLLLIAYFYPPLGGPAVQRPLKLVKYLHKFGWETDVISVKDIVYHSEDYTLLQDDESRHVYRTKSKDAMSLLKKASGNNQKVRTNIYFKTPEFIKKVIRDSFFIDDKIGWLSQALKQADLLMKSNHYDAVMATIGPYTSGLVAYHISKKYKLPLIIDYRDHWNLGIFKTYLTPLHRWHAVHWEQKILKQAHLISVVGRIIGQELADRFGKDLSNKMQIMYNGWDESDFSDSTPQLDDTTVNIRYVGNFYSSYSPGYFIKAMDELYVAGDLPKNIRFTFVGNYYREVREMLKNAAFADQIEIVSQVEHPKAIDYMRSADGMLLFIAPFGSKGVLSGKLFEYLRAGREIMSMLPMEGEAAEILQKSGHDLTTPFADTEAIKDNFLTFYNRIKSKKLDGKPYDPLYNRENQTKMFVKRLEREIERKQ